MSKLMQDVALILKGYGFVIPIFLKNLQIKYMASRSRQSWSRYLILNSMTEESSSKAVFSVIEIEPNATFLLRFLPFVLLLIQWREYMMPKPKLPRTADPNTEATQSQVIQVIILAYEHGFLDNKFCVCFINVKLARCTRSGVWSMRRASKSTTTNLCIMMPYGSMTLLLRESLESSDQREPNFSTSMRQNLDPSTWLNSKGVREQRSHFYTNKGHWSVFHHKGVGPSPGRVKDSN